MVKSPEALVKPSLLIWARESAGFSQEWVASKLRTKQANIEKWECGDSRPSISQLRRLSQLYKRPLAVFFLSEPPRDFTPVRDYRRLASRSRPEDISAELRREINRVIEIRESALDLLEGYEDEPILQFPISGEISENPDEMARRIRDILQVSMHRQSDWRDCFTALREWCEAVENICVLALQVSGV